MKQQIVMDSSVSTTVYGHAGDAIRIIPLRQIAEVVPFLLNKMLHTIIPGQ